MRIIDIIYKGNRKTVKAIISRNNNYAYVELSMSSDVVDIEQEFLDRQAEIIAELLREPDVLFDGTVEQKLFRFVTIAEARALCYPDAKEQLIAIYRDRINSTDLWKELIDSIETDIS